MGGQPASGYTKIIIGLQKKKMANWDHVISGRMSMGDRDLCLALNAARRRREEEEERRPGVNPFLGRGIVPRFRHWEGVQGEEVTTCLRGGVDHSQHPHRMPLEPSLMPNPTA